MSQQTHKVVFSTTKPTQTGSYYYRENSSIMPVLLWVDVTQDLVTTMIPLGVGTDLKWALSAIPEGAEWSAFGILEEE